MCTIVKVRETGGNTLFKVLVCPKIYCNNHTYYYARKKAPTTKEQVLCVLNFVLLTG